MDQTDRISGCKRAHSQQHFHPGSGEIPAEPGGGGSVGRQPLRVSYSLYTPVHIITSPQQTGLSSRANLITQTKKPEQLLIHARVVQQAKGKPVCFHTCTCARKTLPGECTHPVGIT